MANEHVVVQLDVDATGAAQGIAQFNNALDGAHRKAADIQQTTMKMFVGVPQSVDRVSLAMRKLEASIDPVTKAQFQMEREMTRSMALIERAVRTGVTTEQQAANTIGALRQKQVRDLEAVRKAQERMNVPPVAANQNRRMSGQMAQGLGFQANDIATMALMGASPSQIAFSQGGQILQTLQMSEGGISGSLKEIKGSAMAAAAAVAAFLGPVGLIAVGFGLAAAAAGAFYLSTREGTKSLEEATKDQLKAVQDLAAAYGIAGVKAEDFQRKSQIAADAASRRATGDLEKSAADENAKALGQLTRFITPGRSAGGFFGPTQPEFKEFNDAIQQLRIGIAAGHGDFDQFEKNIHAVVMANPGLQETGDKILKIAEAATEAAKQLGATADQVKKIHDFQPEHGELLGLDLFNLQQQAGHERRDKTAWADFNRSRARSPQEILETTRRQEELKIIGNETAMERADRIRIVSTTAYAEAELRLVEAHKQRTRALEETLASSRLDLELIGKTTGEQAALRMEFEKTQELRQQAAQNGIEVDQKELDLIHQKAVEYGKLADAIQKTNLLRDIQFERDQLFRLPGEQQIASRLRGTGMGLDSEAVDAMRWNQNFAQLKDGVRGFFDDFEEGLLNGDDIGEALGKAILNGLNKVLDNMLDQVLNQLANSITSAIMGTGAGGGGAAAFGTAGGFMEMLLGAGGGSAVGRHVGGAGSGAGNFAGGSMVGTMAQYAQAIKDIESSGGNYNALGPLTARGDRAYGAYQVMGSNIPSWTRSALGHSLSRGEFLHDRGAQDAVFQQQFGNSISKYGSPQDAASVWFTGRPQGGSASSATDILGTSGREYVDKFNKALGRASDTTASVTKDIGGLGKAGAEASQGVGQLSSALSQFPSAPGAFKGGAFGAGGGGLASLFGGGGGPDFSPWEMSYFTSHAGLWAKGGVFNRGNVIPFARGGVVDRPTLFPMANGAGLMGEAGPEAVMPLRRGANGSLGVAMHGGGSRVVVNVINNGAPVSVEQRTTGDGVDVILTAVESHIAKRGAQPGTPMSKMLEARNARSALKRFG